jgi:Zn-dependent protease
MTGSRGLSVGVPKNAFVPSPVFVGVLALVVVSGVMTWRGFGNVRFDAFLLVISGWVLSLCLHEYAHAIVAYFSGDVGVAERGYLRLNPLKYAHPVLSIVLPVIAVILGGIGLPGGAVLIDHQHIRSRVRQSLISLAGPATNLVFALVLAVPFALGLADVPELALDETGELSLASGGHIAFWSALALMAFLQVTASVLNLLPVPGLDGGNMLHPWLSEQWKRGYNLMAPYGFLLLFALLWQQKINVIFFDAMYWLANLIGVDRLLAEVGFNLMRFWQT